VDTLTILHLSDLHFGDRRRDRATAELDADAEKWWELHPLFTGYLGNSHNALRHLNKLHTDLKRAETQTRAVMVAITGDFTTTGSAAQFDFAQQYLSHSVPTSGATLGLNLGAYWNRFAVPGNHDHWPGKRCEVTNLACMRGNSSGQVGRLIYSSHPHVGSGPQHSMDPWIARPVHVGGKDVVVCGIDSDVEVDPHGLSRIVARGQFDVQCRWLLKELPTRRRDEVRVLMIHHSYDNTDFTLGMAESSRVLLEELLEAREISIMLSGHMHGARVVRHPIGKRAVVEARCGTSSQRMSKPKNWSACPSLEPNTVLIHRLRDEGNALRWEIAEWWRPHDALPFEQRGHPVTYRF
jgi:predicted MPP superfamily phosphohydrolase